MKTKKPTKTTVRRKTKPAVYKSRRLVYVLAGPNAYYCALDADGKTNWAWRSEPASTARRYMKMIGTYKRVTGGERSYYLADLLEEMMGN